MTSTRASHAWYARRTPVRVDVECSGAGHHVTWRRGRLVVEDHDLGAERALRGLGAEKARCLEILDAWRRLNGRPALEELSRLLWGRPAPRHDERLADAPLPEALRHMAALATIVRCERRWDDPDFPDANRRLVGHELTEGFGQAIRASLASGRTGGRRLRVRSRCELLHPGETASVSMEVHSGRGEVAINAGLPISWLVDVWGRGIAAVDNYLVVEAASDMSDRVAVAAIDWRFDVKAACPDPHLRNLWLRRDGERWHADNSVPAPRLARRPWWSVEVVAGSR